MWPDSGPTRNTRRRCYRCSVPGLAGFTGQTLCGARSLINEAFKRANVNGHDLTLQLLNTLTVQTNNLKSGASVVWRRGWDSNPRYGSPYTAFPVLPIQPLLHLARPNNLKSSASVEWRRGWDSNPRWSFPHSGFRDRCTNPLCDLSTSEA